MSSSREMSNLGHQVRNLMAIVLLSSESLEKSDDARVSELAKRISGVAEACAALCKTASDVTRAGDAATDQDTVQVGDVISSVLAELKGVNLLRFDCDVSCAPELRIVTSRVRLYRLLYILLLNTAMVNRSRQNVQVSIKARGNKDSFVLEIEDNGDGLNLTDISSDLLNDLTEDVAANGVHDFGLQSAFTLAHELRGHLALVRANQSGTMFRFSIEPSAQAVPA